MKKITPDFTLLVDKSTFLKLPRIDEAPILFELVQKNRSHLREFLGWLDSSKTLEDTKKFIEGDLEKSLKLKELTLTIWFKEKPVGLVSIHEIDYLNGVSSIGYWIDKDHEGMGIMTKSVKALINFAFKDLNLHRLEIRSLVNNTRSQSVAKRLGFQLEGTLRQAINYYGNHLDAYLYGLVKE